MSDADLSTRVAVLESEVKNIKENDITAIKEDLANLGDSQKEVYRTVLDVKSKLEKQDGLKEDFKEFKRDVLAKLPEVERKTDKLDTKLTIVIGILSTIGGTLIAGIVKLFFFSN